MARSVDYEEEDYRVSLIEFTEQTVVIRTWWVDGGRYALLSAALGDPGVESIYPRSYITNTAEEVLHEGTHVHGEHSTPTDPTD